MDSRFDSVYDGLFYVYNGINSEKHWEESETDYNVVFSYLGFLLLLMTFCCDLSTGLG